MRQTIRHAGLGLVALTTGLLSSAPTLAASTNGYRVLHHESVHVLTEKGTGANERMTFNAYGRRFALTMAPNERIRRGVPSTSGQTLPLQGTVEGLPGSWVRITRSASGLRGMMFDGQDMYAIEPAAEAAAVTVQPLIAADGETVVYRLADAMMPVETMTCEVVKPDSTPDTPPTAADALEALSSELHTFQIAAVAAMKQVRVGVIGDFEFVSQFTNSTPEDAIVSRMNIVDGIFSTQLGVKISLATPTLFRSSTDPFTKSNASELLTELSSYRQGSPAQRQLGITHLMTGRNLDTTTVGIAYINGLCSAKFGTSLSQSNLNTTQAALIAAHEIGHNFGAPHDGESPCQSTPTTFLMAPQLNGSDQFSACSVQQMQNQVNTGNCLTAYVPPDASIQVPTSTLNATVNTPVVASFVVRATGDDASANVNVMVTLPTSVTVQSVSANGGTCTNGAGTASCSIGTLAAGDSRQVDLNVTPTEAGTLTLNLSVDSSNDPNSSNDTGTITIVASTTTPTEPPPSNGGGTGSASGGGGGGGSFDYLALSFLGVMVIGTARRRSVPVSGRRAA
jgi:hypothetical protein